MLRAVLFSFLVVVSFNLVMSKVNYRQSIKEIEAIRLQASRVLVEESNELYVKVANWNSKIQSNQNVDRVPILGLFVDDRWRYIQQIKFKNQK
jgi:hypothetical protein